MVKYGHIQLFEEVIFVKKLLAIILCLALTLGLMISVPVSFAEETDETIETYALFDKEETQQTGYWMHPFIPGEELTIEFDLPVAATGFEFFASTAPMDNYMEITFTDINDNIAWQGTHICVGDALQSVQFGTTIAPGFYTLSFKNVANPDYPEGGLDEWFVLGSGLLREDYDITDIMVQGYKANDSLGAPWLEFYVDKNFEMPDATPTPKPETDPAKLPKTYPLFDKTDKKQTGYWMFPFIPDEQLIIEFELPYAATGFEFFASTAPMDNYIKITFTDDNDNEVWSDTKVCRGDALQKVQFGKTLEPGYYTLTFTNVANPDYPEGGENEWFVLGSGAIREDLEIDDIYVEGFIGNDSLGAPWIEFYVDQDYVMPDPTPTPEPTATPTASPLPTDTPAPTEAPTEAPTATPEPAGNGCGGIVGGGFALIALAAAAVVIRKKH